MGVEENMARFYHGSRGKIGQVKSWDYKRTWPPHHQWRMQAAWTNNGQVNLQLSPHVSHAWTKSDICPVTTICADQINSDPAAADQIWLSIGWIRFLPGMIFISIRYHPYQQLWLSKDNDWKTFFPPRQPFWQSSFPEEEKIPTHVFEDIQLVQFDCFCFSPGIVDWFGIELPLPGKVVNIAFILMLLNIKYNVK